MSAFGGAIKESQKYDIALMGIPFDGKSCYLKGAAKGPEAIRAASKGEATNSWTELGVNLEREVVMVDLGDVEVRGDFLTLSSVIEERISAILKKKAVPFVLGGDHSISYPIVKTFSKKFRALDILHFDAHPDLYEQLHGDRFSHACPFARIVEEGIANRLVQVGIRAATTQQRDKASRYGVEMIEMRDVCKLPPLAFSNPLYISFDMDALDPAFAPGVSHHEAGGLTTRQVLDMMHSLEAEIVGMDVVELNPDRDPSGITAAAAVKIIKEAAGQIVIVRKTRQKEES
ncbi:MAG: agmatinase [Candidatus Aminicenantes bacterium]